MRITLARVWYRQFDSESIPPVSRLLDVFELRSRFVDQLFLNSYFKYKLFVPQNGTAVPEGITFFVPTAETRYLSCLARVELTARN